MSKLHDSERCTYATRDGRRCRKRRAMDGVPLCVYHFEQKHKPANSIAEYQRLDAQAAVARELLPNNAKLDSADAVSKFIARVTRYVAHGRIEPRVGNSLGYLGQVLLTTIAQRNHERAERAAAQAEANQHPIFGQWVGEVEKLMELLEEAAQEENAQHVPAPGQPAAAGDVVCAGDATPTTDDVESASIESAEPPESTGGSE